MTKARELAELGAVYDSGALSNRNLIINGAMAVAQRGTSTTGITTSGFYTVDRFDMGSASSGTWTMTQDTNAPSGFSYSVKCECTTAAASPGASEETRLSVKLEAQDLQQLGYGSSDAKQITLSFWVKSNKTGSAALWFYQHDAARRCTPSYTINTADTWEYKTITVPADTSGTINNDNGIGLQIGWYLSAGSTYTGSTSNTWAAGNNPRVGSGDINFADATSNYIQITGVQLEVGPEATPFEHRSYGDELARCQRYYQTYSDNNSHMFMYDTTSAASGSYYQSRLHPVVMRAAPTASYADTNSNNISTSFVTTMYADSARWTFTATASDYNAYVRFIPSYDAEL